MSSGGLPPRGIDQSAGGRGQQGSVGGSDTSFGGPGTNQLGLDQTGQTSGHSGNAVGGTAGPTGEILPF